MNPWFCTNLGDAMLAAEALGPIQELFWAAYQAAACPADMAIFQRHESEGRLHCELKLFFSPATAAVAKACAATTCPKPAPDGLGLLAGPEQAWSRWFPDR